MAIIRINEFRAAPEKSTALRAFLRSVIHIVEQSPGCVKCELAVDVEDAARLVIIETWDSIAAHKAAATRVPPEKLAEVRPLLAEPPRGQYYEQL
jgi:quinol monooxygenase YgiN